MRRRLLVLALLGTVAAGVVAQSADGVVEASDDSLVFHPAAVDMSDWTVLVGGRAVDPAEAGVSLRRVGYDFFDGPTTTLEIAIPFPAARSSHTVTLLYNGEAVPDVRLSAVFAQVVSPSHDHGIAALFARFPEAETGGDNNGARLSGETVDSLHLGHVNFVGDRVMVAYAPGTPGFPHRPEPSRFVGLTFTSPATPAPEDKDLRLLLGNIRLERAPAEEAPE